MPYYRPGLTLFCHSILGLAILFPYFCITIFFHFVSNSVPVKHTHTFALHFFSSLTQLANPAHSVNSEVR